MLDTSPDTSLVPSILTIGQLLASDLEIPDYQRPYKWGVKNVDQLLDDVQRFRQSGRYRVGTVILHESDIVDGQQRFVTFVLIAHWLSTHVAATSARKDSNKALSGCAVSRNGLDVSRDHIRENYQFIDETLGAWTPEQQQSFAEFFLEQCDVVVLRLVSVDEAFQMFDSQNTRGRALYPTDLLKAFHIREMSSEQVSPTLKLDMVRLWEEIPAESINELFSDHLFKIKSWANGRLVPDSGFSSTDVDLFKGIRESDPANADNRWSMPFLYAKNFTDDFRQENGTLIRYGALEAVEYPFQIDQPVINGDTFFKMVAHYYELGRRFGLFAATGPSSDASTSAALADMITRLDAYRTDKRFAYIRNLIDCLVLYYVDRFGEQQLERAITLIVRYGLALRVELKQVKRSSINNYALGRPPTKELLAANLFSDLRESLRATDFLRRTLPPTPEDFTRFPELKTFFAAPAAGGTP